MPMPTDQQSVDDRRLINITAIHTNTQVLGSDVGDLGYGIFCQANENSKLKELEWHYLRSRIVKADIGRIVSSLFNGVLMLKYSFRH